MKSKPNFLVDAQVMRIMMSISAGFAVVGLIIGMFALNCAKVVSEETRKKCTGRWGGTIMLLAGNYILFNFSKFN